MSFNIGDVVKVSNVSACGTAGAARAQVVASNNRGWSILDTDKWWNGQHPSYKDIMKEMMQIQMGITSFPDEYFIAVIFDERDSCWGNSLHGWYEEDNFVAESGQAQVVNSSAQQKTVDPNLYCNCGGPTKIVNICGEDVLVCTTCKKERLQPQKTTTFVF
jgi:hypothetical protein